MAHCATPAHRLATPAAPERPIQPSNPARAAAGRVPSAVFRNTRQTMSLAAELGVHGASGYAVDAGVEVWPGAVDDRLARSG